MHAAADRPEFEPPKEPGLLRGFGLAVLAHVLLVLALTQGLRWQRESQDVAVEAELWSSLPREAAPREVEPPAPPPAPPQPQPVVKAPAEPDPQVQRQADIALEREKQRELEKRKLAQEREREREKQRKLEAQKKREEEVARRKQEQARLLAEAKKEEEKKKREQEKREQEQAEREARRLAQQREENLKRIQGMAGATGAPSSTGAAAQSAGPSASWGARVQARVRPHIVFTDNVGGNPKADVEVRTSPDGTIVGKRLVRSSGNKAWDEAVLRALDKAESLPRDIDGRVPSPVVIGFRPRD